MALIRCPECEKQISEKATACPNCGHPITEIDKILSSIIQEGKLLEYPELPTNLELGKQITNWGGDAAFDGFYDHEENVVTVIPNGKVMVALHTHGIAVLKALGLTANHEIHNSQIISLKQTSREELKKTDKSVIGRAVVGGVILGPLGAIVGGMSAFGNKEKSVNIHYLVMNYWDTKTKAAQTLLIRGNKTLINAFINRNEKEKTLNETSKRKPEQDKTPTFVKVFLSIIIFSIVSIVLMLIFL